MSEFPLSEDALGQADLEQLDELFERIRPGEAMVIEELDGFFTALICSGDPGRGRDYVHDVLGLDERDSVPYPDADSRAALEALLDRHWRSVAQALASGETLAPLLTEDEPGVKPGNLWALGFLRGVDARPDPWDELEEETLNDWLEPIETLAEEIDFESGQTRVRLTGEEREQLLDEMFDTVFDAYQHFVSGHAPGDTAPKFVQ